MPHCCCIRSTCGHYSTFQTNQRTLRNLRKSNREFRSLLKDLDRLSDAAAKPRKTFYILEECVSDDECFSCCCSCSEDDFSCDECELEYKSNKETICNCLRGSSSDASDSGRRTPEKVNKNLKTSGELVNEELNNIWTTLTDNVGNYMTINKNLETTKKFLEENPEPPTSELDVKSEQVLSEEQVEHYFEQIRLYYKDKNTKREEQLERLGKIKAELMELNDLLPKQE